jgi:hypothetical protein
LHSNSIWSEVEVGFASDEFGVVWVIEMAVDDLFGEGKWFTDSFSNDIDVLLQLSISIFDELGWLEFTEWGIECASGDTKCSRVGRLKESSAQHLDL